MVNSILDLHKTRGLALSSSVFHAQVLKNLSKSPEHMHILEQSLQPQLLLELKHSKPIITDGDLEPNQLGVGILDAPEEGFEGGFLNTASRALQRDCKVGTLRDIAASRT
jgi:hypothetical protein